MKAPTLQLYNYFRSSASYRVRIALHHKKLPFEYIPVHLVNDGGKQHKDEYKILNPFSQVPCLTHFVDGQLRVLNQSVAIIEYLDELFPAKPLFPEEPYKKALVRQFLEGINSFAQPMGNLSILQYLEKEDNYDSAKKDRWAGHWLEKAMGSLEELCKKHGGEFCVGNEMTAAEIFLIPQLFTARRFNFKLDAYTHLLAIERKCLEIDAYKKAHPANQPDSV